jgi:hypothetical protein
MFAANAAPATMFLLSAVKFVGSKANNPTPQTNIRTTIRAGKILGSPRVELDAGEGAIL